MKTILAVFHPLLLVTYSFTLLYFLAPDIFSPIPMGSIPYFIGAAFVTTFAVPAISLLFLRFTQRIANLEMTGKERQVFPLFSISAFYAISGYLFYTKMHLPRPLFVLMAAATLLIFTVFLISFRSRVSMAAAAIWGMAGFFGAYAMKFPNSAGILLPCILFLLAGVITSIGLRLDHHTPGEQWIGATLGFTSCFAGFFLFG